MKQAVTHSYYKGLWVLCKMIDDNKGLSGHKKSASLGGKKVMIYVAAKLKWGNSSHLYTCWLSDFNHKMLDNMFV